MTTLCFTYDKGTIFYSIRQLPSEFDSILHKAHIVVSVGEHIHRQQIKGHLARNAALSKVRRGSSTNGVGLGRVDGRLGREQRPCTACTHLHKVGYAITLGNDVDLVAARAPILGTNHIAATTQIPNGDILAATTDLGSS